MGRAGGLHLLWIAFLLGIIAAPANIAGELTIEQSGAAADGPSSFQVRYTSQSVPVAAIQFDLDYDPSITLLSRPGSILTASGKALYSANVEPGRTRFLVAGPNNHVLESGVLMSIAAEVSGGALPGSYSIGFRATAGADPQGRETAISGADAAVSVSGAAPNSPSGTFPFVAAGGGWKTTLSMLNLSSSQVTAKLRTWNSEGAPLPLSRPATEQDASLKDEIELTIPANGASDVVFEMPDSPAPTVGWAQLYTPAGVLAWATFAVTGASGQQSENVVPVESRSSQIFILPFDNTSGYSTGVALANSSDSVPAIVLFAARNQDGQPLLTELLHLPARGHVTFALAEKYAALAGSKGALEFQNTQPGNIAVLGFRSHPSGVFAVISPTAK